MHTGIIVLSIVVVLLGLVAAALLLRLNNFRRGGTAILLRSLPADDGRGWRHGIVRYGEHQLAYYRLSSLRLGPSRLMPRQGIEVGERRRRLPVEADILSPECAIIEIFVHDQRFEVAFEGGTSSAFLSWVESRPSERFRGRRKRAH